MLGRHSKLIILFIIMVFVIAVISISLPRKFLTLINFQSMASQIPEFGLLAIAMMIAMITGGIDLSVVSITNLTGVIAALILTNFITPEMAGSQAFFIMALAVVAAIALSTICGLMNGMLITHVGVPPILASLGTQGLFLGMAVVITKGHGITGFPEKFLFIGSGKVGVIPMPFIVFIVCALIIALVLNKTSLGLSMYMVGSNPVVARFSGINNDSVLIRTYMLTGLLSGISSIIMISRVNSMRPGYGYAYLLQAILVAVLGGTDPSGGFGNVLGVVMGIIILQVLQSGFNILGFSPFFKKFIWGMMLLVVMVINFIMSEYQQRKKKIRVRA
ncbi:Autoinducer 2 import system permease protein LsrD [subsurface metagenome]